jgi:uncharacterized protein (DUF2384 family)
VSKTQTKKGQKSSFITGSQKSGRKISGKDTLIGLNLIKTEKNELIQNIKKGLPISAFEKIQKGLGGKTPLEYADTEPGAREVEDLLGRLEHGVFS